MPTNVVRLPDRDWRLAGPVNYAAVYTNGKRALAECVSLDECKDWKDKGAAMRVYAAQIKDDELGKLAKRVVARANRRLGELLAEYDARGRPHENTAPKGTVSRAEAAAGIGLSPNKLAKPQRSRRVVGLDGLVEVAIARSRNP